MTVTDEVARTFTSLFATLRASMVQQLFAIWFGLPDYRDPNLDSWLDLSVPLVRAAQETSSTATTTYLQMQMELLDADSGFEFPSLDLVTGPAIRNGIPVEEVYSRPFKDVWTALSQGKSFDEAIQMGAERLRQLVETDIQLAHTHTAREIFSKNRDVLGFRRVPSGIYTCALCMVASTQRYNKLNLMPIHPGCDCRVAPVVDSNPAPRVDRETLDQIHDAIARQFGMSAKDARKIDYRKIMVVRNHGEYGPTLSVSGHRFTGPSSLGPFNPTENILALR